LSVYSPRDSQESSPTPQFKSTSSSVHSLLNGPTLTSIHDYWKNHSLTRQTFISKVMSLLFNTLSTFVIAFLPGNRYLYFMVVCRWVCVHVSVCICVGVCMDRYGWGCACVCGWTDVVWRHAGACLCMYVGVCMDGCVCGSVCVWVGMCGCGCVCTCVYICGWVWMCVHASLMFYHFMST